MMRTGAVLADALLAFAMVALAPFAWIMRDGLGPNAVESSGMRALGRWCVTFWTGPILIALAVLAIALHAAAAQRQKERHSQPSEDTR